MTCRLVGAKPYSEPMMGWQIHIQIFQRSSWILIIDTMRCVSSLHCQKVYWVYISFPVWMHVCIPIQYKCIDTNELYFYWILYYRDFTSRYISYRIVYSILVGAGYVCTHTHTHTHTYIYINIYVCIYMYLYAYICVFICVYVYIYVYMPANACYYVYMIICMFFYVCSFYVSWFYDVSFYLWLLGQRWPNKDVQTKFC